MKKLSHTAEDINVGCLKQVGFRPAGSHEKMKTFLDWHEGGSFNGAFYCSGS